jgi:hypothetical protein
MTTFSRTTTQGKDQEVVNGIEKGSSAGSVGVRDA